MDLQQSGNKKVDLFLVGKNKYKMDSDDILQQNHQMERTRSARRYVIACAIFTSMNHVIYGYDANVMSGAIKFIQVQQDENISEVQENLLVYCVGIFSLLGSLGGGKTCDITGRKWTMGFAAIVFQIGAAIMAFSSSFKALMVGGFLAGIGIGFGYIVAPIYIAEISPSVSRGTLTLFPEMFMNFGILLSYVSNYAFSSLPIHLSWRVMLAVGFLPSVFTAYALFVIPESPRWLVMKNRVHEARLVLLKTNESAREAKERLEEIQKAAGKGEKKPNKPVLSRMMIVGIGIQYLQQIIGIDATLYFSPKIFEATGIQKDSSLLAAIVVIGVLKTAFILIAMVFVDRLGRKPLLYTSTIGITFCLFGLGVTLTLVQSGVFKIGLSILFVCASAAFYSVGIGPICSVVTPEIFPLRLRAQATAFGIFANRVCSSVVAKAFLSGARAISLGGTFFVFSAISGLSVVFVHTIVSETKGKSLEEIEKEWQGNKVDLGDPEARTI